MSDFGLDHIHDISTSLSQQILELRNLRARVAVGEDLRNSSTIIPFPLERTKAATAAAPHVTID